MHQQVGAAVQQLFFPQFGQDEERDVSCSALWSWPEISVMV